MNDIVERLRNSCSCNFPDTPCGAEDACRAAFDAADEIERLRAREKDLTLEGLGLIGRIEQARDALAGTDASSLPRDYPLERMAQDRMTEVKRLRAALEIMSMMGGYTKLHPDETAPGVEQNTYSWGVSDGYKEMADIARAALEQEKGGQ